VKLFGDMKVLSAEECAARQSVMLTQYVGTVEIEVGGGVEYITYENGAITIFG